MKRSKVEVTQDHVILGHELCLNFRIKGHMNFKLDLNMERMEFEETRSTYYCLSVCGIEAYNSNDLT